MSHLLLRSDARRIPLPDGCVQCVVTSPPFYGLRDYGTGTWVGGDPGCDHVMSLRRNRDRGRDRAASGGTFHDSPTPQQISIQYPDICGTCGARRVDAQIGLEDTLDGYLAAMVAVFEEVRRVLRDDGVIWVNWGDSYHTSPGPPGGHKGLSAAATRRDGLLRDPANHSRMNGAAGGRGRPLAFSGTKPKDLLGVPWACATALRDAGWYLRQAAPWVKRAAMPESVTDRPSSSLEYVFLFAKSPRYFYDAEAVRRPMAEASAGRYAYDFGGAKNQALVDADKDGMGVRTRVIGTREPTAGRNRRNGDWWYESVAAAVDAGPAGMVTTPEGEILGFDVTPEAFSGSHFATFPTKLVEPMVRAGTSEAGCCAACGAPLVREVERIGETIAARMARTSRHRVTMPRADGGSLQHNGREMTPHGGKPVTTTGWAPSCSCADPRPPRPCLVLDPFVGSGTVPLVSRRLGCAAVGCDLSAVYLALAARRIREGLRPLSRLDPAPARRPLDGQMSFLEDCP